MGQIGLEIAGRRYELAVRDGQEAHFRNLATIVDAKVRSASSALGSINESRQLMMAALMLADEIETTKAAAAAAPPACAPLPAPPPEPGIDAGEIARQVDRLAQRLEKMAETLEKGAERS